MTDHLARHLATMAPHRALLRAVECKLMGTVPATATRARARSLDIGCGDGHFASIAYTAPIDVGIDVRHDELRRGRGPRAAGVPRCRSPAPPSCPSPTHRSARC